MVVVAVEGEKNEEVFAVFAVGVDDDIDEKNGEAAGVDGVDTGFDENEKAVGVDVAVDAVVGAKVDAAVVGVAALVVAGPKEKVLVGLGVAGVNMDVDVDVDAGGVAGGLKTVFLPHVTCTILNIEELEIY